MAMPAFAQAPSGDAKAALAAGDKAAKDKDWARAQTEYRAAYGAAPSAPSLNGLANASYELKSWAEAYEAYDEFVRTYPDAMGKSVKALAEKRMKEIDGKTGAITVLVNEAGAEVSIDDKKLGPSPVRALQRVAVGPHRVAVTKAGFGPFDKPVDVAAGAKITVDANLTREAKSGKLSVKESGGQAVRVVVDGVDVGAAPWEGEVQPGSHEVQVRSATLGSPIQRVEVDAGKVSEVTIVASSALGRVEVTTSDGLGVVYLDGKVVGEGQYAGDVPAGSHVIRVTREGFTPFEKKIELAEKQSVAESVTLRRAGQSLENVNVGEERPFYGIYGGFGLFGAFGVGGLGNSLDVSDDSCGKVLGAASCDTPGTLGAGAFGYVGFTWMPVGIELFVAGMYDTTKQTAKYAAPDPSEAVIAGPARTEEFQFHRVGGVVAIRARATYDTRHVRLTLAAGPGLSYKQFIFERSTSTDTGYHDRYVPEDGKTNPGETDTNTLHYLSPALVGDLAAHIRVTQSMAISVGALMWIETAGNDVVTQPDRTRYLVSDAAGASPVPIRTPRYDIASGAQYFIGPYIGLLFGP